MSATAVAPTAAPETEQPKATRKEVERTMTYYAVLRAVAPPKKDDAAAADAKATAAPTSETWEVIGDAVEANSAKQAIRRVVDSLDKKEVAGKYVAVPHQSFQVVEVKVEQPEPKVVVGS